jgi:serine/threonine protein kinase
MDKYQKVSELWNEIVSRIPNKRPDCGEILSKKHLWALMENELKLDKEMIKLLESKREDKEHFIYSMIKTRLIYEFFLNGFYNDTFVKIEEIGKGFHGTVFKALDKINKDFCAIKRIEFKKENISEILRKLHNFSIFRGLNNKYIVEQYKVWLENITDELIVLYIKMELCDTTLEQVIDEIDSDSHMKTNEALTPIGYYIASQLFIEILEGVQYLHENNIIHRNLNPIDIFLKKDEENKTYIKIDDFDLIAIHKFAQQTHTQDIGSVRYMAPEVRDDKKYDTKADIFSLGIILRILFNIDIYE